MAHATVQSEPMPRSCPRPAVPLVAFLVLLATSYLALTRLPAAAPLAALITPSAGHGSAHGAVDSCAGFYRGAGRRAVSASVEEFGAVGDGVTSNTAAFRRAVAALEQQAGGGGARLEVPPGRWLTGSFNLTSRFTLFLHHDAVILGSQDNHGLVFKSDMTTEKIIMLAAGSTAAGSASSSQFLDEDQGCAAAAAGVGKEREESF